MVKMPKRVRRRWREIFDDPNRGDDTIIEVLLTSRLHPVTATDVLSQSVRRVVTEFEETHTEAIPEHGEPPFAGEWDVVPVPEGALLVFGRKSDDADGHVLEGIVEDLSRHGLSGKLDVYSLPEIPPEPGSLNPIEATIQILGHRVTGRSRPNWELDQAALDRVIEAATCWCLEARPDRAVTLQSDVMPTMVVRRGESPYQRVRELVPGHFRTRLKSIADERYRELEVAPYEGRITILEAGPCLYRQGWAPSLTSLTDFITRIHQDAIYARIRRVRGWDSERSGHDRLGNVSLDAIPYADHLAPDAFAVQLLGPGYQSMFPTKGEWHATQLRDDRVLLEHVDPAAWIGELELEDAIAGELLPRSEVVQRARAALSPILFPVVSYTEFEGLANPALVLPQSMATKAQALPNSQDDALRHVAALVLRDGRVIENVELTTNGAIVARIDGTPEFKLDPHQVIDVLHTPPAGDQKP